MPGLAERPINIFLPRLYQVIISYSYTDFVTRLYDLLGSSLIYFLPVGLVAIRLITTLLFEQFFQSPHASLRKLALGSVNQYIIIMPAVSIVKTTCKTSFLFYML